MSILVPCSDSQWTCFNRDCIDTEQVCDGQISCSDGSDETYFHARCYTGIVYLFICYLFSWNKSVAIFYFDMSIYINVYRRSGSKSVKRLHNSCNILQICKQPGLVSNLGKRFITLPIFYQYFTDTSSTVESICKVKTETGYQRSNNLGKQIPCKVATLVCMDLQRTAKSGDKSLHYKSSDSLSILIRDRKTFQPLCELIRNHEYVHTPSAAFRKRSKKIYVNSFLGNSSMILS